ncbi:MAG: imidazole glycerol phosphate synthase subunit HisH [Deltaproteobacteria bacterium]|nr:imidazole glycerol phosphate synthase subunit HisH [Deltaproteobacteria bacterium]
MDSPALAIVDLGLGNLRSVEKAVAAAAEHAGLAAPVVTHDVDVIARAARIVVPGQGAFRDGAAALAKDGGALGQALRASIARGTPYLGICLGLQLLLDESEEAPGARGLGVFAGSVVRIPDDLVHEGRRLKVPHMGWNQPHLLATRGGEAARDALGRAGEWFYFVHSYHAIPHDPSVVAATATYGCLEITAALAEGSLLATQFHPEKSQRAGLALLEAFLRRPRP